jgi:hypothetical protein
VSVTCRGLVDVEDLSCAGCGEPVVPEPPISVGKCPAAGLGVVFSHRDGSELCGSTRIEPARPVEAEETL